MRITIITALAVAMAMAAVFADGGVPLSDDDMKAEIVSFLSLPSRLCGRATIDFRNELKSRKLTNRPWFGGDTNRLARLICELAQTNDNRAARTMIRALGEYGTNAQLPFLYSCATNPVLGRTAVESVLRVEGVTSNSLAVVADYLTATNLFTRQQAYDRAICCAEFIREAMAPSVPAEQKERALLIARNFAANVNTSNSVVDKALLDADSTYRYSVRRLSVMRAAYPRCFNEYQTNYVANAISELVDYPESELPD